MIKAGIVGCGKIADQHATQIGRIPGCRLVGVCDREELMAKQLGERFGVRYWFSDLDQLLEMAKPDVVHITTPPQTHYELALRCLEAGCHVYVEKPFTLITTEAEALFRIADEKDLKVTAGHNVQYNPEMVRMRELIDKGYLGGSPTHMESIYCYTFVNDVYAASLLGNPDHWVRKLPGKLLHNIISHGISKIAEFMVADRPLVIAHGFTSPALKERGETEIVDELRVTIHDEDRATAYFTFSSQIGPMLNQFRVFGPKNSLIVDHIHRTVIRVASTRHKSYLKQFIPPATYAMQYLGNSLSNINRFLKKDFHYDYGMKTLMGSFYQSIAEGTPLPLSRREILVTSRIMDDIFTQIYHPAEKTMRAVV